MWCFNAATWKIGNAVQLWSMLINIVVNVQCPTHKPDESVGKSVATKNKGVALDDFGRGKHSWTLFT